MTVTRASTSSVLQGFQKYQTMWDQDTEQGAIVPIQTISLSANAGAINFAVIPSTYQHLFIVASLRDTTASVNPVFFNFINNNGGSVYSATQITGDGASASSGRISNQGNMGIGLQLGSTANTNIFATNLIYLPNYNSPTFKTIIYKSAADNNGSGATRLSVGSFRDTNPITQFSFNAAALFLAGSQATLYGIKAVV